VSAPVAWEEVEELLERGHPEWLVIDSEALLGRVEEHGDLFAPLLTLEQRLPALGG
jgi:bifunctional non-homologous end joining protein LigD